MTQNNLQTLRRFSILVTLLVLSTGVAQAQSGGGIDQTGTGGRHAIQGRLIFPSGQRADYRIKIKLESPGMGDLSVLSDVNGNFSFQSLRPGSYQVIVEGGEHFETVRESVVIESAVIGTRNSSGMFAIARPFNVQIYLREKGAAASSKPGVLNAALATVPKAAVEHYQKGVESVSRGETDQAIDHLKRAVGLHPNFALALNELGVQYLRKGELDKAAEALTKALQLAPDAPEPSLNYGIVLLQQKKFAEAQVQLRDAVKKNDSAFTAHLYLGITLIHFKNFGEAETEFRKAITLGGPKASQAHYYLGGLYWQVGNFRQAADELETYLKLEPKAANADRIRNTIKDLRAKS
jgi:Flp pilus assembly protein TadD